ncbi:DsbA family oxidoreductase [Sulfuricurvum sp.]|uniref:DsbA family oxidoreductase n=1 Tax=Sulfuricurvum sp. TaxID=2025608 RepID=UPI0026177114|nr:DsbA family oxidoreductase [Sulfuricurvum sp.]MDD2267360.1 DsbA family oxidoreductase [Sulfuricurvum sp.]
MKIEIWSDFACPYCYIGKRKLEEALEAFPELKDITIVFKSFELDPTAGSETIMSTKNRLMKKYGKTELEAKQMMDSIVQYADHVGLKLHYDTAQYTNTFDAHRIAKYAQSIGKEKELLEKLFYAYFIDNKQLSSFEVLTDLCREVGLDIEKVKEVLNNNDFAINVRMDEEEAQMKGIHSVPFFVIDEKYAVSGAQSAEVFKKIIKKVLAENEEKIKS